MANLFVTAKRQYLITDDSTIKCEHCKVLAMKTFRLIPLVQTRAISDDLVVCYSCIEKLGLDFNVDIVSIIEAGGVNKWVNNPELNPEYIKYVTAIRDYLLTDDGLLLCDCCKVEFKRGFKLLPSVRTQAYYDDLITDYKCIKNLKLEFNVDIDDVVKCGGVNLWLKAHSVM